METQSRGSICPFKRNSQWKNRAEWKWETLSRRKCRRWRRRRKFARVQEIPKCQVESGWSIHIWHQQELETKTFSNAQWVVFIYLFYKKKKKGNWGFFSEQQKRNWRKRNHRIPEMAHPTQKYSEKKLLQSRLCDMWEETWEMKIEVSNHDVFKKKMD